MSHIKTELEENRSWCGEQLGTDFYFKNAELAALSGASPTDEKNHSICTKCIDTIVRCLDNGRIYE